MAGISMYKQIQKSIALFFLLCSFIAVPLCAQSIEKQDMIDFEDFLDTTEESASDTFSSLHDNLPDNDFFEPIGDAEEQPSLLSSFTHSMAMQAVALYYACKKTILGWHTWLCNQSLFHYITRKTPTQ